jgi:hypothetical protein
MNRFLKKEWEDTEIPERAYLQARNRAWSRLTTPAKPAYPSWIWATAAVAVVAGLALFRFSGRENYTGVAKPVFIQTTRQEGAVSSRKAIPAMGSHPRDTRAAVALKPRAISKNTPAKSRRQPVDNHQADPDRLVLDFVLPESGVRMIWILDKDFQLNGEIE